METKGVLPSFKNKNKNKTSKICRIVFMISCSTWTLKVSFFLLLPFQMSFIPAFSNAGVYLLLCHLFFTSLFKLKSTKGKVCNSHLQSAISNLWYKRCKAGWYWLLGCSDASRRKWVARRGPGLEGWLCQHHQHLQTAEGSTGPVWHSTLKPPYLWTSGGLMGQLLAPCLRILTQHCQSHSLLWSLATVSCQTKASALFTPSQCSHSMPCFRPNSSWEVLLHFGSTRN
jgi:hypothetical protein